MSQIATLSEFLEASGCQWFVYDLSRQVKPLEKELIRGVELGQQPFPTPRQQKAWLAVVFWQSLEQPFIWFVSLPLDERGGFQQAAMQHFMSIIVEALGHDLTSDTSKEQEALLEQNPYIFTPDINKRAAFHAQFTRDFGLNASMHFETADAFFRGHADIDWQQLGLQGIHDVMHRQLQSSDVHQTILGHFHSWPDALQQAVCHALEHASLPTAFADNIVRQIQQLDEAKIDISLLLLQALSSVAQRKGVHKVITQRLDLVSEQKQTELLVLIAARLWKTLEDPETFNLYFAKLSAEKPEVFQSLFKELVTIPTLRMNCLQLLHTPHKNEAVQTQIARLIAAMRSSS